MEAALGLFFAPMRTGSRDRVARGTVAALIVVVHALLAYFLIQPLRRFTTPAPGAGESVLLLLPGDSREAKPQAEAVPAEPMLQEPQPVFVSTAPNIEIRPASDDARDSSFAQVGSGRPNVPATLAPDAGIAVLQSVMPQYPIESMRAGEEGAAVLQVLVDESGRASDVRVARSSGYERLDVAAVTAVSRWKFAPSTQGSLAVATWGEMEMRFNLYRYGLSRIVDAPLDLVAPGQILNAANEVPVAGGEQALRALMEEVRFGDADSLEARWSRDDMRRMKQALAGWGGVQTIQFKGPAAGNRWRSYEIRPEFRGGSARQTVELRWDVYQVAHERGVSEWRIALDHDGAIWAAHIGRAGAGTGLIQVSRAQ